MNTRQRFARGAAAFCAVLALAAPAACSVEEEWDSEERSWDGDEPPPTESFGDGYYFCDWYDCDPEEIPPGEPPIDPSGADTDGIEGGIGLCTPYTEDCDVAIPCCGTNVCAYDGERDEPWCQPFERGEWAGRCVKMRTGAKIMKGGQLCKLASGLEVAGDCMAERGQSCMIGWYGECGEGEYTVHTRDLAQVPVEECP